MFILLRNEIEIYKPKPKLPKSLSEIELVLLLLF
jgi:hypothetical protein